MSLVLAHASVRTESGANQSAVNASETYRLQVPVEKPMATTLIRMVIPEGVIVSRFLQTPGWERTVVKNADGIITEVSWKGTVEDGEFVRFYFQAKNPANATKLAWKIYQTYADGTIVGWDDVADGAKFPASITEIK